MFTATAESHLEIADKSTQKIIEEQIAFYENNAPMLQRLHSLRETRECPSIFEILDPLFYDVSSVTTLEKLKNFLANQKEYKKDIESFIVEKQKKIDSIIEKLNDEKKLEHLLGNLLFLGNLRYDPNGTTEGDISIPCSAFVAEYIAICSLPEIQSRSNKNSYTIFSRKAKELLESILKRKIPSTYYSDLETETSLSNTPHTQENRHLELTSPTTYGSPPKHNAHDAYGTPLLFGKDESTVEQPLEIQDDVKEAVRKEVENKLYAILKEKKSIGDCSGINLLQKQLIEFLASEWRYQRDMAFFKKALNDNKICSSKSDDFNKLKEAFNGACHTGLLNYMLDIKFDFEEPEKVSKQESGDGFQFSDDTTFEFSDEEQFNTWLKELLVRKYPKIDFSDDDFNHLISSFKKGISESLCYPFVISQKNLRLLSESVLSRKIKSLFITDGEIENYIKSVFKASNGIQPCVELIEKLHYFVCETTFFAEHIYSQCYLTIKHGSFSKVLDDQIANKTIDGTAYIEKEWIQHQQISNYFRGVLASPMQRAARYPLLFNDLIKKYTSILMKQWEFEPDSSSNLIDNQDDSNSPYNRHKKAFFSSMEEAYSNAKYSSYEMTTEGNIQISPSLKKQLLIDHGTRETQEEEKYDNHTDPKKLRYKSPSFINVQGGSQKASYMKEVYRTNLFSEAGFDRADLLDDTLIKCKQIHNITESVAAQLNALSGNHSILIFSIQDDKIKIPLESDDDITPLLEKIHSQTRVNANNCPILIRKNNDLYMIGQIDNKTKITQLQLSTFRKFFIDKAHAVDNTVFSQKKPIKQYPSIPSLSLDSKMLAEIQSKEAHVFVPITPEDILRKIEEPLNTANHLKFKKNNNDADKSKPLTDVALQKNKTDLLAQLKESATKYLHLLIERDHVERYKFEAFIEILKILFEEAKTDKHNQTFDQFKNYLVKNFYTHLVVYDKERKTYGLPYYCKENEFGIMIKTMFSLLGMSVDQIKPTTEAIHTLNIELSIKKIENVNCLSNKKIFKEEIQQNTYLKTHIQMPIKENKKSFWLLSYLPLTSHHEKLEENQNSSNVPTHSPSTSRKVKS